jgi:nucleotide-binding universal stress UspA family protein
MAGVPERATEPILLATDGTPSAVRAVPFAIRLARLSGRPLEIVSVWTVPALAYGSPTELTMPEEAAREHAHAGARAAAARAHEAGVSATVVLRRGEPAAEICTVAEESGAVLVVVGAWSRWGRRGAASAGIAAEVVDRAPCPVVIARADLPRVSGGAEPDAAAASAP